METTVKSKADVWRDRIDAQHASGQSVRAWCKDNDVREHSFYWWRARLGLSPAKRPSRRRFKPIAFAQVVVNSSMTKAKAVVAETLRLRLAGDRELILPGSMPLEQVARLIHAIEGGGEACRVTG